MQKSTKEYRPGDVVRTRYTGPHVVLWSAGRNKDGTQRSVRVKRSPGKRGSFIIKVENIV